MYTIKQAAMRTGLDASLIRAWERRYGVVRPARTASGYRLYGDEEIARLRSMRDLIERGWSAAQAAVAVMEPAASSSVPALGSSAPTGLVAAAARYDPAEVEGALDDLFGRGSFESVIDDLVLPSAAELGQAWADGRIDVAAEHLASSALMRRLSALFDMAGAAGGTHVALVGLPPGSRHELGALAFAVVLRRMGIDVVYLGPDVPVSSWVEAARVSESVAAIVGVVTSRDVTPSGEVAAALRAAHPELLIAFGGAFASHPQVSDGVVLPTPVVAAAHEIRGRLG
jgi:DNA-binding transcriptional MerR regulator/methylmalonyl-CoA mutase cobalamin-binding subunit